MVTQKIVTRLSNDVLPPVRMVSGDVGREILLEIYANDESQTPIDLETYSASITIIKPDNTFVIEDFDADKVELPQQAGAVSGHGYYQIKIFTSGDHQIYTGQGPFIVDDDILNESIIESVALVNGYVFPDDFLTDADLDDYAKKTWVTAYVTGLINDLSLDDLKDVFIGDDIHTGDVLRWDGEKWTNDAATGAEALDDLTDVDITSPTSGEVLTYDGSKWENAALPTVTKTATGNPIEFSDGADALLVKCVTQITGYQSGTGTPSPDNIRPIVAYTDGEIEVSDGDGNTTTHTATFSQSIYQGNVDFIGGVVTSEWKKVKLKDLIWTYLASNKFFYATNGGKKAGLLNIISNAFKTEDVNWGGSVNEGAICGNLSNATIYIQTALYDNVSDFVSWLTTLDAEAAFEITPTTETITPTNLPIKSLFGYNHIESSTGDMEVEYITQQYEPLMPCHHYSTAEQVVGKWVDGSDLKEKTYVYTGTGAANPFTATIDMTGKSIIEVIPHYAKYTYGGGSVGYCAGSKLTESNSAVLKVEYDDATPPTVNVTSYLGSSTETYEIAFTIRYI